MFDPNVMLVDGRFGYILVRCSTDYHVRTPRRELYNPLRWVVGIGRGRPCPFIIDIHAKLYRPLDNLRWRLWAKRRWERKNKAKLSTQSGDDNA